MKKRRANSITISLISTTIMLLILAFLSLFQFHLFKEVKQENQYEYESKLAACKNNLYNEISVLQSITTVLSNDYKVLMVANAIETIKPDVLTTYYIDIIKKIQDYRLVSSLVYEIQIMMPNSKLFFSTEGYKEELTEDLPTEQLFYVKNNEIYYSASNQPNIIFNFKISKSALIRLFNSFYDFSHNQVTIEIDDYKYVNDLNKHNFNLHCSDDIYNIKLTSQGYSSKLYRLEVFNSIFIIFLIIMGFGSGLISLYTVKYQGGKLLEAISTGFYQIESGNLSYRITKDYGHFKENKEAVASFNNMCENLEQNILKTYQQEILLKDAENKRLQSQINPHFLHNTYFFLRKEITLGHYEEALDFAFSLSQFFKYITYPQEKVSLYLEYDHAINYLNIQTKRLKDRVILHIDKLPNEYKNMSVPYLIIEPIIENSFKYVFEKNINQSELFLKVLVIDEKLCIFIEDSGSIEHEEFVKINQKLVDKCNYNDTFSCLKNIKSRLNYNGGDLEIYETEKKGLGVKLILGGIKNV